VGIDRSTMATASAGSRKSSFYTLSSPAMPPHEALGLIEVTRGACQQDVDHWLRTMRIGGSPPPVVDSGNSTAAAVIALTGMISWLRRATSAPASTGTPRVVHAVQRLVGPGRSAADREGSMDGDARLRSEIPDRRGAAAPMRRTVSRGWVRQYL
jgi:hypothetical protein